MNDTRQTGKASADDKPLLASALLPPALLPVAAKPGTRNGVPLLTLDGDAAPATLRLVNQLRDELP